jgi:alkylated DNA nucleotide flippase Atl1
VISLPGRAGARQRQLLEEEGIVFSGRSIDLERFGWNPLSRQRRKRRV